MRRVLIADSCEDFAEILAGTLRAEYRVEICRDGRRVVDRLRADRTDVLILDLMLPNVQGLDILQTVHREQLCPVILVTTFYASDYIMERLQHYKVDYAAMKPCSVSSLVQRVEELCQRKLSRLVQWQDLRDVEAGILLALNFSTNLKGFRYSRAAIRMLALEPELQVTKEVYPEIAKEFDTTSYAVEKAIRTAIDDAWSNRDNDLWRRYFQPGPNGQVPRPTNTRFLTRLSQATESGLVRRAR